MDIRAIGNMISSDAMLLAIGLVLSVIVGIAWGFSNRSEATPNADQLAEMHHFVNNHFARYVARGLAGEGTSTVAVAQDRAWRRVYLQHLQLHNELYAFRKDVALRVFEQDIDAAVSRELAVLRTSASRVATAGAAT